ncbi:hypothetical protein ACPEIF_23575 [Streptomyces sp. NPDC012600]|uniref:Secreted protein n=2 Tax=Streptomycetaceae TaxID=2062 RepID=A0ABU2W0H1_9ACTN|nr:hypothetical protein [Streptomyces griseus]ARF75493.1 hypothetical protein B7C62_26975 [Kitasatospora albolonga]MDT0491351.1 hypothetical protein [Streptomyces griseus]
MPIPRRRRIIATVSAAVAISAASAVLALMYLLPTASTHKASSADTAELTRIAEGYLQQRADMLTAARPTVEAASGRLRTTPAMATRARSELAALAEKGLRYEGLDIGYTKARVDIEVTSVDVTDRTATLRLTDHARLYFAFTPQEIEDGSPECEESSLPRTMTFTRGADGAWLLSSDKVDEAGGPLPTTEVDETGFDSAA